MTDRETELIASGNKREDRTRCLLSGSITSMKVASDYAISKGFKECGYIRFDGYIVRLHSSLNDETMVKGEGPPEVRTKVKEFLIQLEKESDEIRCHLDNSV